VFPHHRLEVVCDVLKDAKGAAPAQAIKASSDPARAAQLFGGDKGIQEFEAGYCQSVSLPGALRAYRTTWQMAWASTRTASAGFARCASNRREAEAALTASYPQARSRSMNDVGKGSAQAVALYLHRL
jgi:hypothetical protein